MQNGDRYSGMVLGVTSNTLTFQSEILGKLNLPRAKVAMVRLGPAPEPRDAQSPAWTASSPARSVPSTNNADLSGAFRNLSSYTNLMEHVRSQILGGAGPEANQKFDELLGGLMSGKLNVDDIRQQARASAEQLRALKSSGGDDETGGLLDGYLSISRDLPG